MEIGETVLNRKTGLYFSAALIFLVVSTFFAPRFMGVGPGLAGLGFLAAFVIRKQEKIALPRSALIWSCVFILLALLSAFWSLDIPFTLERTGKMAAIFLSCAALLAVAMTIRTDAISFFYKFLPYAVMCLAGLLLFELAFGMPLYRTIAKIPENGDGMKFVLNRSSVCLALFMLPALFLVWSTKTAKTDPSGVLPVLAANWKFMIILLLFIPVLVLTSSQSAQLASLVALVFAAVFPYKCKWAWYGLMGLLVAFILSAPWLAVILFEKLTPFIESSDWFTKASATPRLEIWDFIARHIFDNFFYGSGIEATRAIQSFDTNQLYYPSDTVLHPHNLALQVWVEFGIIGAVTAGLFCVHMLHLIRTKLSVDNARLALPVFMAWLSINSTGYGIWQSWWLGSGFFTLALVILVTRFRTEKNRI